MRNKLPLSISYPSALDVTGQGAGHSAGGGEAPAQLPGLGAEPPPLRVASRPHCPPQTPCRLGLSSRPVTRSLPQVRVGTAVNGGGGRGDSIALPCSTHTRLPTRGQCRGAPGTAHPGPTPLEAIRIQTPDRVFIGCCPCSPAIPLQMSLSRGCERGTPPMGHLGQTRRPASREDGLSLALKRPGSLAGRARTGAAGAGSSG